MLTQMCSKAAKSSRNEVRAKAQHQPNKYSVACLRSGDVLLITKTAGGVLTGGGGFMAMMLDAVYYVTTPVAPLFPH